MGNERTAVNGIAPPLQRSGLVSRAAHPGLRPGL